jgi:hypothetical protein
MQACSELLTDDNFLLYCASHYDRRHYVDDEEFYTDLNRIKYIKKLFTRYEQTGELRERLILNHIIVLNNVFGPVHTPRIIFLKLKDQFTLVKPFLILLNILPETFVNIGTANTLYYTDDYSLDITITERLRAL